MKLRVDKLKARAARAPPKRSSWNRSTMRRERDASRRSTLLPQETDYLYDKYKLEEAVPSLNLVALNYFIANYPKAKARSRLQRARARARDRDPAPGESLRRSGSFPAAVVRAGCLHGVRL